MLCAQCHTENKSNRNFFASCGASLPLACARCGFANDGGDRFCGGCGAPLATQTEPVSVFRRRWSVPNPQPLTPSPQAATRRRIWPSAFVRNKRRWKRAGHGRRTQNDHGPVCRSQRLDGADRRARSRRSPGHYRSRVTADDGCRPSL